MKGSLSKLWFARGIVVLDGLEAMMQIPGRSPAGPQNNREEFRRVVMERVLAARAGRRAPRG